MKRTAEEQKAIDLQRKSLVIRALLRGKPRSEVAERFQLSEAEVFRIEEDYYSSQASLSEHAQLMKQLTRLEKLLDALWDSVVENPLATNPDNVKTALATIEAVSDLAGLKKTKVEAEIKLIQQQQIPVIVAFVESVQNNMEQHLFPLLTKRGQKQLEAHREEWLADATSSSASILEEPKADMTI